MQNANFVRVSMGIVALTIAFIIFPVAMSGVASVTGHAHVASFTGLSSVANIVPLIAFVWMLFIGGASLYTGAKGMSAGNRDMIYLAISIVGLAIVLYVFPVILDGCVAILTHASIASFTGLSSVVAIAPLIIMVSIIFTSGVLTWKSSGASTVVSRRRRSSSTRF